MHLRLTVKSLYIEGPLIGLVGWGILHIFRRDIGFWAENRGGKRELQLRAGGGFCVIMGLGCGIRKGPEQSGIQDFSSDVIS